MRLGRRRDVEREQHWRNMIGEATRSGESIREFCRRHRLKDGQFYWWQRKLRERQQAGMPRATGRRGHREPNGAASFALVSTQGGEESSAGIELILGDGRRLRIGRGVDEETMRTVLGVLEPRRC